MDCAWAIKWKYNSPLDGKKEYLLGRYYDDNIPCTFEGCPRLLFKTRQAARNFIKNKFGYIKNSEDLKKPPHCWRMPFPVKVEVIITEL